VGGGGGGGGGVGGVWVCGGGFGCGGVGGGLGVLYPTSVRKSPFGLPLGKDGEGSKDRHKRVTETFFHNSLKPPKRKNRRRAQGLTRICLVLRQNLRRERARDGGT